MNEQCITDLFKTIYDTIKFEVMRWFARSKGTAVGLFAMALCTHCTLIGTEDFLPSEEARIEVRAANKKITSSMEGVKNTPSIKALSYLIELLEADPSVKRTTTHDSVSLSHNYFLPIHTFAKEGLLQTFSQKIIAEKRGLFRFNFLTGTFDHIDIDVNYLRYLFPSNNTDRDSLKITAAFTINDVEYVEREVAGDHDPVIKQLISNFHAALFLNKQTQLIYHYQSTYNDSGIPTYVDINMNMNPYHYRMSLTGSDQHYYSNTSMVMNNHSLMSYAVNIRRATDSDEVEKVSGSFRLSPLEWEGSVYRGKMKACEENDLSCINKNLNMVLMHTGLNKVIGTLAVRLYYDSISNREYQELHLLFEDGSMELLPDLLSLGPNRLKYFMRDEW